MQAHHVTRQVEYKGEVVSVTEALIGLPAGGQILLSDATYQRVYGRLHTVTFKDAEPRAKKDPLVGMYASSSVTAHNAVWDAWSDYIADKSSHGNSQECRQHASL